MIRDCNGARAFDTLLRYRGGTLAELWRALRTLKALQAEAAAQAAAHQEAAAPARTAQPDEPERRNNPCDPDRASDRADRGRGEPDPAPAWPPTPLPAPGEPAPCAPPIEPETRRHLAVSAPPRTGEIAKNATIPPSNDSLRPIRSAPQDAQESAFGETESAGVRPGPRCGSGDGGQHQKSRKTSPSSRFTMA